MTLKGQHKLFCVAFVLVNQVVFHNQQQLWGSCVDWRTHCRSCQSALLEEVRDGGQDLAGCPALDPKDGNSAVSLAVSGPSARVSRLKNYAAGAHLWSTAVPGGFAAAGSSRAG